MGLQQMWGLDEPRTGPGSSTQQAAQFRAAFQAALSDVNQSLQYTAAHAERLRHEALANRKQGLYGQYQDALSKIDPDDASKAERNIQGVLSGINQLKSDAAELKRETEAALQAWQAKEPDFEQAISRVGEIEDWGDPQAPRFRGCVRTTQGQVNDHKYRDALNGCEPLLSDLPPVFEEYLRQKAAKERYEPALAALRARLVEVSQCTFKTLVPHQQEIAALQSQMEAAAASKNFVQAFQLLNELTTKIDACLLASEELERKRQAYEQALAALQPRIPATSESGAGRLVAVQSEIQEAQTDVASAAESEDYDTASRLLGELEPTLTEFETLVEQRNRYDEQFAALQPRLPTTRTGSPRLAGLEEELARLQTEMEGAHAAGEYERALELLTSVETKLAEYETARQELERQRQAYQDARTALQPRLPTVSEPLTGRLAALQQEIQQQWTDAETAATSEDYESALRLLGELEPKLTDLESLLEQRDCYREEFAALQPRLPTTNEPGAGRLEAVQQEIGQLQGQIETAAEAADFSTATQLLHELEPKLTEFETLRELRDRYNEQLAALQPRLPTTSEPASPQVAGIEMEITQLRTQMETAAAAGDYETALSRIGELEAKLSEYTAAREEFERQKESYEQGIAALQPRLPTTSQPGPETLATIETEINHTRSEMEAAAAQHDYEKALPLLGKLEDAVNRYEQLLDEMQRRRQAFEDKLRSLQPSLDMAIEVCPPEAQEVQTAQRAVIDKKAEMERAVAAGDYETAQVHLDTLEQLLKEYEDELRKTPRECDWVLATGLELLTLIQQKYLDASSKILAAAQAYDNALSEHKGALDKVRGVKQLVADVVAGIFFAGLGGAAGGAVGTVVKSRIEKTFIDAAAQGGIVDATKDVAKFTTRFIQRFGGEPGNPLAIPSGIGGSGAELGRSFGIAINAQGVKLLEEVGKLARLVKENAALCNQGPVLRIEGDPADSVKSDPFLKELAGIANASKRTFAQLLWGEWIRTEAYSIQTMCSKAGCQDLVEDNIDDFYAWWGDLIKNIEAQAGDDFGLRQRMDEARREVERKIEERRSNPWHGL